MIIEHTVTHGDFLPSLRTISIQSEALFFIVIAVLTTILSYQLGGILLDMIFGFKPKHEAKVSDLHLMLLSDDLALIPILASIFRVDFLDRLRFRNNFPKDFPINRTTYHTRKRVYVKLLFCLLSAPLGNLTAVILTTEIATRYTFKEGNFGGLAFGFSPSQGPSTLVEYNNCNLMKFHSPIRNSRSMVEFYRCSELGLAQSSNDNPQLHFKLKTVIDNSVILEFVAPTPDFTPVTTVFTLRSFGAVFVNGTGYRVKLQMDMDASKALANAVRTELLRGCQHDRRFKPFGEFNSTTNMGTITVESITPCEKLTKDGYQGALAAFYSHTTLINADELLVLNNEEFSTERLKDGQHLGDIQFHGIENLEFLEVRRNIVELGPLILTTSVVLLVRFALCLMTENDVKKGIEWLLKSALEVPPTCSLLGSNISIPYNFMYVDGMKNTTSHYGVPRFDLEKDDWIRIGRHADMPTQSERPTTFSTLSNSPKFVLHDDHSASQDSND